MQLLRKTVQRGAQIALALAAAGSAPAATVDFAREVYPIFQRACFECHGVEKQKGKLRLDSREEAFKAAEVIVKGNASQSELYRRITLPKGHDDIMPNRGEPLSKTEAERIKAWIDSGAAWPDDVKPGKHWAYVKPVRPEVPEIQKPKAKVRSPIDNFILARLEKEGLSLSPEAEPAVLVRRVYLDLIGLPPSPKDVDEYLDSALRPPHSAFESLVDRLLASPQFGERWARPWLDLARYADSHGFQRDDLRDLWPYRDWVIRALNVDMPFTQFTIEQLAGDLLPNATQDQKVATGFNRSAPTNVEAGTEPEETRVNQVLDRINTLGAVWLGTTLECCQCHNHKYDPFTQRDYYRLFAFFNNTALEADRANPKVPGSIRFIGPTMDLTDAQTDAERAKHKATVAQLNADITAREQQLLDGMEKFEADLARAVKSAAQTHALDIADFDSKAGSSHKILDDKSVLLSDDNTPANDTYTATVHTKLAGITGFKLEALTDDSLPGKGPGRGDESRPNFVLNQFLITVAQAGKESAAAPVKLVKAKASFSQKSWDVENLLKPDKDKKSGWAINPQFHQSHWATFTTDRPVGFAEGTTLTFKLVHEFGGGRTIGRLRLSALTGDPRAESIPADLTQILATPKMKRTAAQTKKLNEYCFAQDKSLAAMKAQKRNAELRVLGLKQSATLVMQELDQLRPSAMFNRGNYTDKGEPVQPGTPEVLHPFERVAADMRRLTSNAEHGTPSAEQSQSLVTSAASRLDLARWLVDRENPLVARVTVNRWWAELFGHGLVTTPEDFGLKGELPTHPELLDWLACEFMDNGWSMKKLLKTIVMSATYRQSSKVTPELFSRDDQNLLYARGPRFRLDAETIRDNVLAVAGLLSLKQGGPPIRPPQPDGLWEKVGGQKYDYVISPGDEKYRRGIYVVWKRGSPYPSFVNFDATARLACKVKRSRSNTPLQALTLLNDPVYVEAAQALARRVLTEEPVTSVELRIRHAFRLALVRAPKDAEVAALKRLYDAEFAAYQKDAKAAKELLGGNLPVKNASPAEFAAMYSVSSALLNLDEAITKN